MKKIISASLLLLIALPAFAGGLTKKDLAGIAVAYLDIEGPFFVVQLIVNEDGTYNYRDANMDQPMAKAGCDGTYTFNNQIFEGLLDCAAIGGPSDIQQKVDFSNVTQAQLNSEDGASVMVESSLLPGNQLPFKIYKQTELYFKD